MSFYPGLHSKCHTERILFTSTFDGLGAEPGKKSPEGKDKGQGREVLSEPYRLSLSRQVLKFNPRDERLGDARLCPPKWINSL